MVLKRTDYVEDILHKSMNSAFDKVFHESLLVNFNSGKKLTDLDLSKLNREFIDIVISYSGQNIVNDYVKIRGSLDSFLSYLSNYFYIRAIQEESELLVKIRNQQITT